MAATITFLDSTSLQRYETLNTHHNCFQPQKDIKIKSHIKNPQGELRELNSQKWVLEDTPSQEHRATQEKLEKGNWEVSREGEADEKQESNIQKVEVVSKARKQKG